ncbi:MAG: aminotransferase class V-fold PLP-dependent enzyme [Bacteroidia bacterium]|nr:aminotransferase class V-fold PLP-dependent enzyme [Bacteroidia bacterium]
MKRKEINSSRMPVYRDAGFELFSAELTAETFRKETENHRAPDHYIYSRYRNPTVVSAEEEIMKLEGCDWALLTQSGMSAIDTALSVFQNGKENRPWLFFSEIYGGSISFVEAILKKRRGIDIHYFMPSDGAYDLKKLEVLVSSLKPEVIYIESVSNPMLIVTDVPSVVKIAKKNGSRVILDNTFATPFLYKPLNDGVDLVIHSVTKYFSGHGNISAGVICGNNDMLMRSAIEYRKFVGHMLSPDDAYRLETQIKTFNLRFKRQCENASALAEILQSHPAVERVWYPGMKNHETHAIAKKLFRDKGYGGMITFDLKAKGKTEKGKKRDRFISYVSEHIKLIPTLGDPHTILMPVESVWGAKYPEPGMIRLSVGFEEYSDILETITMALNKL